MAMIELHPDFKDFLKSLNSNKVKQRSTFLLETRICNELPISSISFSKIGISLPLFSSPDERHLLTH